MASISCVSRFHDHCSCRNGASARIADPEGRTAFHWAMKIPNIDCLKWLCEYANIPEVINQPVRWCSLFHMTQISLNDILDIVLVMYYRIMKT